LINEQKSFILTELFIHIETRPVIMIDDDPEDLDMTREMVEGFSIPNELITFMDPLEALASLVKMDGLPLLIICDVNMPRMDGFELRTELLKNPGTEKIPFFFFSTSKSPGEIMLAQECKADGYYQKAGSFGEQLIILDDMFLIAKSIWQSRNS
ncbi:MAG: response regulator, partial [Sediminibacterium sp.]